MEAIISTFTAADKSVAIDNALATPVLTWVAVGHYYIALQWLRHSVGLEPESSRDQPH